MATSNWKTRQENHILRTQDLYYVGDNNNDNTCWNLGTSTEFSQDQE